MKKTISLFLGILMIAGTLLTQGVATAADKEILGAGATFPYPLYSKMFDVYHKGYGVKINYQAIGSGGGVRQILSRTVDFGASDAFMKDKDLRKAPSQLVHIPICLGAVAVTFNLPGSPQLKFSSDVLTDIFLGKITKWNDSRIQGLNPVVSLPNMNIVSVHRSDGSGTTFIFTDYLAKVSSEWKEKVGRGKSVNWPSGLGAKGNQGVAGLIKQIPGSIGYVELAYTIQNNMPQAALKNKSGNFIRPSLESTSLAADAKLPEDTRVSLTDSDAASGYPISGFTWILTYQEQEYGSRSKGKARELVKLLWWMIHSGQEYMKPLHYAPLPDKAVEKAEKIIKSITYDGETLLKE